MHIRALKDEAASLFSRGKFPKAAEAYGRLLALDAADPLLRLRHAEACRRCGRRGSAVASYRVAAELFAAQGHLARAQAALKLALGLLPGDSALLEARQKLEVTRRSVREVRPTPPFEPPPPRRPRAITLEVELPDAVPNTPVSPAAKGVEIRRLSDREVAVRVSPDSRWAVLSSATPMKVRFTCELSTEESEDFLGPLASGELCPEDDFQQIYGQALAAS